MCSCQICQHSRFVVTRRQYVFDICGYHGTPSTVCVFEVVV